MTTATHMLNRQLLSMAAAGDRPRCSDPASTLSVYPLERLAG